MSEEKKNDSGFWAANTKTARKVTTTVEAKWQAGTLLFKLPDKAKKEAIELPVQVLQDGRTETVDGQAKNTSGVDCLLEKLDELYRN